MSPVHSKIVFQKAIHVSFLLPSLHTLQGAIQVALKVKQVISHLCMDY